MEAAWQAKLKEYEERKREQEQKEARFASLGQEERLIRQLKCLSHATEKQSTDFSAKLSNLGEALQLKAAQALKEC